jgi:hypothetical protein
VLLFTSRVTLGPDPRVLRQRRDAQAEPRQGESGAKADRLLSAKENIAESLE